MNSKSFHRGPSNIISSLILFNICHCRILVMIEFRRGILVDSFSSFSLSQRPKKSALVKYIINGNCVLRVKKGSNFHILSYVMMTQQRPKRDSKRRYWWRVGSSMEDIYPKR